MTLQYMRNLFCIGTSRNYRSTPPIHGLQTKKWQQSTRMVACNKQLAEGRRVYWKEILYPNIPSENSDPLSRALHTTEAIFIQWMTSGYWEAQLTHESSGCGDHSWHYAKMRSTNISEVKENTDECNGHDRCHEELYRETRPQEQFITFPHSVLHQEKRTDMIHTGLNKVNDLYQTSNQTAYK